MFAYNTAIVAFPTPGAAWTDPTHYRVVVDDAAYGTALEKILVTKALSEDVDAPQAGSAVTFAIGKLSFELPEGDNTTTWAGEVLKCYYTATKTRVRLFAGANEIAGTGYAPSKIAAGAWTIAAALPPE